MPIDLVTIFESDKSLAGVVIWDATTGFTDGFEVPLELDGVTIAGLRLRGKASRIAPDEDYMLQLEYCPGRKRGGPLDRIDWRPFHTHENKGRGPALYRFMRIEGSHHHQFELNWHEPERRMLTGNLPVAVPLTPQINTPRELFEFAEDWFRIAGLRRCPLPRWQGTLFG